jgi:hypothetical protein
MYHLAMAAPTRYKYTSVPTPQLLGTRILNTGCVKLVLNPTSDNKHVLALTNNLLAKT